MRKIFYSIVLLCYIISGCGGGNNSENSARSNDSNTDGTQMSRVVVILPERDNLLDVLTIPGTLEGFETVAIYARTTGYLNMIRVDIGDEIHAGGIIASLDVPELEAQYEEAKAELAAAEAKAKEKAAQLKLAQLTYQRLVKIRSTNERAATQQNIDEAEAAAEVSEAAAELAGRQVQVARAKRDHINAMLEFKNIKAPFDGKVLTRNFDPGELVRSGHSSGALPILEVSRTDRLRLGIDVPEPFTPFISKGDSITYTLDVFPGEIFTARLSRIAGGLHPQLHTLRCEIDLSNADGRLQSGMYASVHMGINSFPGAVSIPSKALRRENNRYHIYTVIEGKTVKQPVSVLMNNGVICVIGSGLSMNTEVVLEGPAALGEGQLVSVTTAK